MIRVKISNSERQFATIDFQSQSEADAYIEECKVNEHWGKSDKDIMGFDVDGKTLIVVGHQNAEVFFATEDISAQVALDNRIAGLIVVGQKDAEVCEKCLALIGGYNIEKGLTPAQIQSVATQFSNINYCLTSKMPRTAKSLISAIVVDEYSTEIKTLLLEVLKAY